MGKIIILNCVIGYMIFNSASVLGK